MKNIYSSVEEYEKNCYLFAPSISRRERLASRLITSAGISAEAKTSRKQWNGLR